MGPNSIWNFAKNPVLNSLDKTFWLTTRVRISCLHQPQHVAKRDIHALKACCIWEFASGGHHWAQVAGWVHGVSILHKLYLKMLTHQWLSDHGPCPPLLAKHPTPTHRFPLLPSKNVSLRILPLWCGSSQWCQESKCWWLRGAADKVLLCCEGNLGILSLMTVMGHPTLVEYTLSHSSAARWSLNGQQELQRKICEMNNILQGKIHSCQAAT